MTGDQRLRDLERVRDDSPEDSAAWLRERVRRGLLGGRLRCESCSDSGCLERDGYRSPDEHLALAAYCGHAGARLLVGGAEKVRFPGTIRKWNCSLVEWFRGLAPFGEEVGIRAAVAAQREAIAPWSGGLPIAIERLNEVESWLDGLAGKPGWLNGDGDPLGAVTSAARECGGVAVREAIQAALIEWVLG